MAVDPCSYYINNFDMKCRMTVIFGAKLMTPLPNIRKGKGEVGVPCEAQDFRAPIHTSGWTQHWWLGILSE